MMYTNRMWFYMMYSEMWYAVDFPCRCGGGYADKIFIITSGENMAIHAAANIAMAVENFKNRGYAGLGGLILNRRDVPREEEKVAELADDFHTAVIGTLSHSGQVALAEEQKKTLMECYPTGEMADEYRALAMQMYRICGGILEAKSDKVRSGYIQEEA